MKNKLIVLCIIVSLITSNQITTIGDSFDPSIRIVTVVSNDELIAGSSVNVTIYLKNDGLFSAKDVNLTLESSNQGIVLLNTLAAWKIVEIKSKDTTALSYDFRLDMNLEPGVYPITLSGNYLNQQNELMSYNETFFLEILGNDVLNHLGLVASTNNLRSDEINSLSLLLANNSQSEIADISIAIENLPLGLSIDGSQLVRDLTLAASNSSEITTNIHVSKEVTTGYYTLDMVASYKIDAHHYYEKKTVTLWVEASKEEKEIKELSILSMTLTEGFLSKNQMTTLTCVIKNISDKAISDVIIEASTDVNLILTTQTKFLIDTLEVGESVTKSFTYKATDSSMEGNIPIEVVVTYDDQLKSTKAYSGVYVDTKKEDDPDKVVTKPRIIIDSYELSKDTIYVGDLFELTLNVMNTNQLKAVSNLKMTMTASDGMGFTTDLLPVNLAQSKFLGELTSETLTSLSLPFEVLSTASGQIYTLDFVFEYEDKDGLMYTDTEKINIPIYQLGDITISDVRLGKILDNGYKLELDFYNTGKVNINNLMVDIEGNFQPLNSNYYVGDFITGRMDVYDVQIQGDAPEWIKGTVIMTYDDTFGKEIRLEIPFNIENLSFGQIDSEALLVDSETDETLTFGLVGMIIPILLIGGFITLVVMLIRKKRRGNEVH